ncbi:MAG: hypothetical protein ACM65K_11910 [Microcoleus sp.]
MDGEVVYLHLSIDSTLKLRSPKNHDSQYWRSPLSPSSPKNDATYKMIASHHHKKRSPN